MKKDAKKQWKSYWRKVKGTGGGSPLPVPPPGGGEGVLQEWAWLMAESVIPMAVLEGVPGGIDTEEMEEMEEAEANFAFSSSKNFARIVPVKQYPRVE